MKPTEYSFSLKDLDMQLASFAEKGITELSVHDQEIASKKNMLLQFLKKAAIHIPEVYISIVVNPEVIDLEVIDAALKIFCSFEINLCGTSKECAGNDSGGVQSLYLFDKKLYSKKATLLNNAGLVFGFMMDYAVQPGDSLKLFRDRLDFAVSLYPNHIDFAQLHSKDAEKMQKCTGTFSSQDISFARSIAFAATVFYSFGRAVPWFLSVLQPLKISPAKFFADFAEWQRCNNCDASKCENPYDLKHAEIEKMQVLFLELKYEEKKIEHLFPVVYDIVRLNGAFSRVEGEGEECEMTTSFNPDDLLSPAAYSISSFADNVCMEECHIKIFAGPEYPDYKII